MPVIAVFETRWWRSIIAAAILLTVVFFALAGNLAWATSPRIGPLVEGPDSLMVGHEGDLPIGRFTDRAVLTGLKGNGRDQLIVEQRAGEARVNDPLGGLASFPKVRLLICEATSGGWKVLQTGPELVETQGEWTSGDLDHDGRSDLVVFKDGKVHIYSWKSSAMKHRVISLPSPLVSGAVGDLNRDGKAELAAFIPVPVSRGTIPRYALAVFKWTGASLQEIWRGKPAFHGWDGGADIILGIADVKNIGKPKLVIMRGQSDVRPSTYVLFGWNGNALVQDGVMKQASWGTPGRGAALVGRLQFFVMGKKVHFMGNLLLAELAVTAVRKTGLAMLSDGAIRIVDIISTSGDFEGGWTWGRPMGGEPGLLLVNGAGHTYFYTLRR